MRGFLTCLTLVCLVASTPLHAHDGDDHQAQFGGTVIESGHHHLEVVARDGVLEVHVGGEHGTPEMVSQATATASVLAEGRKVDVELKPDGGTALKGALPFKSAKGAVVVITLRMPQHDPEQVRLKLE